MNYVIHICIMASIYTVLAVSLDLLAGQMGIMSVAHAAFYGIGAYSSAVLSSRAGAPFWLGLLAGIMFGGLSSLVVSLPASRLRGDYFMIATFSFQIIAFSIFDNWQDVTRGALGIPGIPAPSILGLRVDSDRKFLILAGTAACVAYFLVQRIASSPFGRVLRAIREDELFAKSLGKNTLSFQVTVFAVSAALAASAGSLYAHYITYIDPSSFTVMESILIISMVIIGGAASRWGPLIGAVLLVLLPELLRFIGLPASVAANLRQILYGSLLVIMMMFRPRGIAGRYGFGR
jgi:branched-chain amino acid transport system permease protein